MRKVCPNLDREAGLDTVLEVPLPELHHEPPSSDRGWRRRRRRTAKAWVRSQMDQQRHQRGDGGAGTAPSRADVQLMLGVIGAPLVPQPVEARRAMAGQDIKEEPIEVCEARYIVEQYVAAAGGEPALSAATSMYAMGRVRMRMAKGHKAKARVGAVNGGGKVDGSFVVWQKRPEMWCVDVAVTGGGTKMSAGSDGKVAWRQEPWQTAQASRGPPRPLRRCVQGLDPKSTADLFSTAVARVVGEKCVDGDDCFVIRVDADAAALRARSSATAEVVRHAVWGYFSQRTGLLVRLEDRHLLRVREAGETDAVYWETSMESSIGDYRPVDGGINVAHGGRTVVSLSRSASGGEADARSSTKTTAVWMEETWSVEEVGFNVVGLSTDCFLPPRDMIRHCEPEAAQDSNSNGSPPISAKNITVGTCDQAPEAAKSKSSDGGRPVVTRKAFAHGATGLSWFGPAKVVAVETVDAEE